MHVETVDDFRRAVRAKVSAVMHLPGYMANPQQPQYYRLTPDDARAAADAGVAVVTTLSPSANSQSGPMLAGIREIQRDNLRLLRDAGVKIALGGDQYGADMFDEFNLINALGLFEPAELLAMATENGARLIYPDRKLGRLEPGYEASLLAYPFDPRQQWLRLNGSRCSRSRKGSASPAGRGYCRKAAPRPDKPMFAARWGAATGAA